MSWATLADLLARFERAEFPELTQLTAPAGAVAPDEPQLQAALEEAAAMMRGLLGARAMPGSADDANLRRIQCNLARWTLYRDAVPERVQQIYQADIDQLRAISRGEQQSGSAAPDPGGEAVMLAQTDTARPPRGF